MSLERTLRQQYGVLKYRKTFSSDFKEAVKGIDSISRIVSNGVKRAEKKSVSDRVDRER